MRYVVFTDTHLADTGPRMRTASYKSDVLAKLRYVMQQAALLGADRVIGCGDLFHRRTPRQTSHLLVQEVRAALTQHRLTVTDEPGGLIPISLCIGNHDQAQDGTLVGQPLASVIGGHITLLDGPCADDPNIVGVRWRPEFAEGAADIFLGFERALSDNDGIVRPLPPLVFAHAPIVLDPHPFGGSEERGWITATELARIFEYENRPRLIMAGHIHSGHPVRFIDTIAFANAGALSRGTIADSDRERTPQFAIVDYLPDTGVHVEYRPVPARPAADVFLLNERAAQVERSTAITALSQAFLKAESHVVTRDSLLDALDALKRPEEIPADEWLAGVAVARASIEEQA